VITMDTENSTYDTALTTPHKTAVVCHDAGAANIIIASLLYTGRSGWRAYMRGPAKKLWEEAYPGGELCEALDSTLDGVDLLISGTGWSSDIEHEARTNARDRGVRSVAIIDHWTNYRTRFIRDELQILPDEIWVTDQHAKGLVEREFVNIKVVQLPNLYLKKLVQEVRQHESTGMNQTGSNLLYVLEPIRHAWGKDVVNGEFLGLDFFVKNLAIIGLGDDLLIRLRPHPSDPIGKYDQWLDAQKGMNISLDVVSTLAESVAWADVVVGCQTYAMVVALAAGRRVFSSNPPWAPQCVLPHPDIIKLSDFPSKITPTDEVVTLNNHSTEGTVTNGS